MNLAVKEQCTGCGACANVCPNSCIDMVADEHGFEYPKIDEQKCVHCNLCERACPVGKYDRQTHVGRAYAMMNCDEQERLNSSSGGVFSLISKAVLSENGVVFGAGFDEQLNVRHTFIESVDELYRLRGSKYVQSSVGYCYREVADLLKRGKKVLFSGTPCQTDGLKQYLEVMKIPTDKLILVDVICHGVPAPEVWNSYRQFKEVRNDAKIKYADFRSKDTGWKDFSIKLEFENGKCDAIKAWDDLYVGSFLRDLSLRPSCYACPSKGCRKLSDITLADFWGVAESLPEFNDDKGVSLVIANSKKGQHIIDGISHLTIFQEVSFEQAIRHNKSWSESAKKPKTADYFMKNYKTKPFDRVALKCEKKTGVWKLIRALRDKLH